MSTMSLAQTDSFPQEIAEMTQRGSADA